ncbi:acyl-CoA dehydrogenase family protein [Variovorax sp. E3]|uniref:acyl-CoA dehydrogenase family protein n=1 Tax=Variovorax sp. E3 TaxID=1914993 RepID=UPI0027DC2FEA|nr:acyl-CoA dehydrogenase family protein [Variovorax sp. E3]
MNSFTEQDNSLSMVCDSLARYLEGQHGFEQRLHALTHADHAAPPFWRGLSRELDLLAVALPESQGGFGGGMAAHLAVMRVLGDALAAEPYLSTMVIGAGLLARHPGALADDLLARIVGGEAVLAFAHSEPGSRYDPSDVTTQLVREGDGFRLDGHKAVVQAAPWASHLVVSARGGAGLSLLVVRPTRRACACAPTRRATAAAPPTSPSTTCACRPAHCSAPKAARCRRSSRRSTRPRSPSARNPSASCAA